MNNSLTSEVHDLRIIALPKPFWYHLESEVAWTPILQMKTFFPETDRLENFQIFNFACETSFSWTIFFRNIILKSCLAYAPNKMIGGLPNWKLPPSTQVFLLKVIVYVLYKHNLMFFISFPLITMLLASIRCHGWHQIEI